MDIQSCKISATKDKPASRSGLAALAELIRKLGLDVRFERPEPGSSRGFRSGAERRAFHALQLADRRLLSVALHHRKRAALDIYATAVRCEKS